MNFSRLVWIWNLLRSSLWFVPSVMTIGALVLVMIGNYVDRHYRFELKDYFLFFYQGGPEGARQILSTIAGSMITVAGVTFSITIVALSLASQQFGPRLLQNFMRDRANQMVLGTFIATFIYCLAVLPTIRGTEDYAFVPYFSVMIGVGGAIASLAVLIYFIHHVSHSIQADVVVRVVSEEFEDSIDRIYPEQLEGEEGDDERGRAALESLRNIPFRDLKSGKSGYVQFVDGKSLSDHCCEQDIIASVRVRPGDFVTKGMAMVRVWAPPEISDDDLDDIHDAFIIGTSRTTRQDVEFAVLQLVEVAVRSLSPGINDPFTAVACVDRIHQGMVKLVNRPFPSPYRFDDSKKLRLVTKPFDFPGLCDVAFNQMRQYGSSSVTVTLRLLETITRLIERTERTDRIAPLIAHGRMILHAGERMTEEERDLEDMRNRFERLLEAARKIEARGARIEIAN